MRFDNSQRMAQLDVILKSKKCRPKGRHGKSSHSKGSCTSDRKSCDRTTITQSSQGSRSSGGSSTQRILRAPSGKHVIQVQDSWQALKVDKVRTDRIGEIIVRHYLQDRGVARDRIYTLATLMFDTLETIVSQLGPTLFEEDFASLRNNWINQGLDPRQVAKILVQGLRDCTARDIFAESSTTEAWEGTVVAFLLEWGGHYN